MELPSCEVIAQEEAKSHGFCPVGYKVPFSDNEEAGRGDGLNGQFGFVSGCVWGDDCSWKLQYLDLSRIDEGIIQRDDRFGYVELPRDVDLKHAISDDLYFVGDLDFTEFNKKTKENGDEPKLPDIKHCDEPYIEIAVPMEFDVNTGKLHSAWSVIDILEKNGYKVIEPKKIDDKED